MANSRPGHRQRVRTAIAAVAGAGSVNLLPADAVQPGAASGMVAAKHRQFIGIPYAKPGR